MKTAKMRLFSLVTALALVLTLGIFLPEGALRASAATVYEQKIQVNVSSNDESKFIKFGDSSEDYSKAIKRSCAEGETVTLEARPITKYHYFDRWAINYGFNETVLSYEPIYTYTVTDKMNITAVYNEKYKITFVEDVPAQDTPDLSKSVRVYDYQFLMPGEKVEERSSIYFGKGAYRLPYVPVEWIDHDTGKPYDFSQPVNKDKTLTMRYEETDYKYRLKTACSPADGGVAVKSSGSDQLFYKYGEVEMIDCDPETGYRFAYWIDDSPEKNQYINHTIRYAVKGNYTLTAVFKPTNTASSVYDVVVEHGAAYAANGATRKYESAPGAKLKIQANQGMNDNQIFDHWEVVRGNITLADPKSSTTTFTMPAEHAAVRAIYKTVYTVSFDANGGTGYMEDVYVDAGKDYILPECGFTAPAGKEFLGWEEEWVPGTKISLTGNITLKARWGTKLKTVNVTLTEPKAGEERVTDATTSTTGAKLEARVYSHRGYVLQSDVVVWYTGSKEFIGDTYSKNKSYTAHIRLVADDGYEITKDTKVTANGKPAAFDSFDVTGTAIFTINYDLRDRIPGDVNGDGKVDLTDVIVFKQSIAGWKVTINKSNADVNADTKADIKDVIILKQKLAGWKVTLK